MAPVEVFYSCSDSRDDAPLLKQLEQHLSALQREGLISTWHKRQIVAGSVRQTELDRHFKAAKLILLLVSSDFLASDYCWTDMQRALERHKAGEAQVLPILLRPCLWERAPFAQLEVLPTGTKPITQWSNRDDAWKDVVLRIHEALDKQSGAEALDTQPATEAPARPRHEKAVMQTVKVLFLAANPARTDRLAIDEEMRAIEQKVRAAKHREALEFRSNWAVQPDDLLQLLNQHHPQIVHFSGHGSHAGLSLAGRDGQVRVVSTQALAALFETLKGNIRLVFLNACYSREQGEALIKSIDCVIGMNDRLRDGAAAIFASSFYRALGFGLSIQKAFEQGKTALLLEGVAGEDVPELLVKAGVDPTKVVLVGPTGNPL